jgi:hypothetical protein
MPAPPMSALATGHLRQQVLMLYLSTSALDSQVLSWSLYDGAGTGTGVTGEETEPPYPTGLAAMQDGWRLLALSELRPGPVGLEYATSFHNFEFVFERIVELAEDVTGESSHG